MTPNSVRKLSWVAALVVPAAAAAHILLVDPPPRSSAQGSTPPCAGAQHTGAPVVLDAGAPLTVTWDEPTYHGATSLYRIYYSANTATLVPSLPLTGWMLEDAGWSRVGNTIRHKVTVMIPPSACTDCTLQVFEDGGNGNKYFSCADVTWGAATTDAGQDAGVACNLTCQGCCDSNDVCNGGTTNSNCGSGGALCQACTSPAVCGVSGTGGQCFGGASDSGPTQDSGTSGGQDASTGGGGGDAGDGSKAGGGCNSASSPLATSVLALAGALSLALLARRRRVPARR